MVDPPDTVSPTSKTASVSIHDGSVVAGDAVSMSSGLLSQVRRFIDLNRATLLDYWEERIDTDDPDFRFATSVVDYIFRRLAADYLSPEDRAALNVLTTAERKRALDGGVPQVSNGHGKEHQEEPSEFISAEGPEEPRLVVRTTSDAPMTLVANRRAHASASTSSIRMRGSTPVA